MKLLGINEDGTYEIKCLYGTLAEKIEQAKKLSIEELRSLEPEATNLEYSGIRQVGETYAVTINYSMHGKTASNDFILV